MSEVQEFAREKLASDGWSLSARCTDPGGWNRPSEWRIEITGPSDKTVGGIKFTMGSGHRTLKKSFSGSTYGPHTVPQEMLECLCRYHKMHVDAEVRTQMRRAKEDGLPRLITSWLSTLKPDAEVNQPYFQWATDATEPTQPDISEVLYCIASDALAGEGTFADFCADLGFDPDSIKALKVYGQCQEMVHHFRAWGVNPEDLSNWFSEIGY